ncbi:MAG: PLP-dependent aminotransferase family protein [Acetobacter sp.]|nr:PLP-dependent aminotransferase family protein [Bacteroides sp.]MCM1341937.1 PLP-dependent aminotransferase family protein [Acetobacter sp.]MCM1434121.1 PLP-dependent aminotransferase family protein [Clostridiales bacterium]
MKKYLEIYNLIKSQIISKELKTGQKIPSVRNASVIYNVSITTVQNAYFELCADGYIVSQNKSGYYVTDIANSVTEKIIKTENKKFQYDLTGGTADKEIFDLKLWQRYIKSALRQSERMMSYSEPQGEYDLRLALAEYIKEKRNVVAPAERIIIGAGSATLLGILCSLIDKDSIISFPDKSFAIGMGLFEDYGFDVRTRHKDADVIYVSPSHMTRWGDVMPIKRRIELTEYSSHNNSIVIEDDYENEFLYNVRPTPSLFALGKGNVVYLSSFSAMLIPAIRISFMVLTPQLYERYKAKMHRFAQTAGKTEQIALCNYIRDGHINAQTRKISRFYGAKTKEFTRLLKANLPASDIDIGDNTLQVILKTQFNKSIDTFEKLGLKVFTENYDNGKITLVLSPSGIPYEELENVAKLIKKAILS